MSHASIETSSSRSPAAPPDLAERIEAERLARQVDLIGQEHRLIPAAINLAKAILEREPARRSAVLPSAIGALVWCLVPNPATASVGLIAIASLFVSWQQAALLRIQNDKIEVQNMLAEAQRRSGLMFEISAIFQLLEEEKTRYPVAKAKCKDQNSDLCWNSMPEFLPTFTPSRATSGRIAALTQALRPYRYLSVEDQGPYRFRTEETSNDVCPESVSTERLGLIEALVSDPKPQQFDLDAVKAIAEDNAIRDHVYSSRNAGGAFVDALRSAAITVSDAVLPQSTAPTRVNISCRASSPERGQLLVALHAAAINISALSAFGADFRYADMPGAKLSGILLQGVNLSFARLPAADFSHSQLRNVDLSGSHIAGARFQHAMLEKVQLRGAILQSGAAMATNASLIFANLAETDLEGARIFEQGREKLDFVLRWCVARDLAVKLAEGRTDDVRNASLKLKPDNLLPYALLVESTRRLPNGPPQHSAIIVHKSAELPQELFSNRSSSDETRYSYLPFGNCK